MKICKNKKSGKRFICIDVSSNGMRLMISPSGDVKALEKRLFTEPVEVEDAEALLVQGLLNDMQYKIYTAYYQ